MVPSSPLFSEPAEPFAPEELATAGDCDPVAKAGVIAFRDFVLAHERGSDLGIVRACAVGGASEHKQGRAWDWGISASLPDDRDAAERVIGWLLANDAEIFRRVGLIYLIFNRKIWSVRTRSWVAYHGSDPHTGHVHFSFGTAGAMADGSFYRWLAAGGPVEGSALRGTLAGLCAVLLVVGAGVGGWWIGR